MTQSGNSPIASCVYQEFAGTESTPLCFSDHYLAYSAAGSMRLEIESRYFFLQPTKAVWIPAGKTVIVQIPTAVTCCSILFNPDGFPDHTPTLQTIELTPLARHMILHCRQWSTVDSSKDHAAQTFYRALASVIVERMDAPTTDWVPRGESSLVSRAVDLTLTRYREPIEITEIASELASSDRTLSRRIVEETGMTWSELLRRIRIVSARELLVDSKLPVTTVAAEVGYTSQSAFNRAFKVETGHTPRSYQAQHKSCYQA